MQTASLILLYLNNICDIIIFFQQQVMLPILSIAYKNQFLTFLRVKTCQMRGIRFVGKEHDFSLCYGGKPALSVVILTWSQKLSWRGKSQITSPFIFVILTRRWETWHYLLWIILLFRQRVLWPELESALRIYALCFQVLLPPPHAHTHIP